MIEELLSLQSLHGTTTGEEIFYKVEKGVKEYGLGWDKLKCVTTDGARNMCGKSNGLIGHIFKACENIGKPNPVAIHCIIHQQVLCSKNKYISSVTDVVTPVVNFIRSRGLNHRQFRAYLQEIDAAYSDIPYHTAIRWLSNGKVLLRFIELKADIMSFLEEKNYSQSLLLNEEWQ